MGGAALAISIIMNNAGNLPLSESAARRVKKPAKRRGRPRKNAAASAQVERSLPAAGTLMRTKSLLLAALRVWELKHRISE